MAKKTSMSEIASIGANFDAASEALRQLEGEYVQAGLSLVRQAGAAAALARGDRRARTLAESHIARLLERGGPVDLNKFQRDLDERPHLFAATLRALYRVEQEHIIAGWWRNGTPVAEDALRRAAAGYSQDDDVALTAELSRAGVNPFHLAALAFQRVGVSRPDLFGRLTWQEEAREIDEALALVDAVAERIRKSPVLMAACCEAFGVQRRPGLDAWNDLLDAAVAVLVGR